MKPVWQNIKGVNGNCMQAAIASILELELEEVPNFKLLGKRALRVLIEFMKSHNYSFVRLVTPKSDLSSVSSEIGVNGYFFAIVRSQVNEGGHHAVVIDKNCNIVHPVNKKYEGITEFEKRSDKEINGIVYIFVFNPTKIGDTDELLRKNRLNKNKSIRSKLF
jgi:hypothetical protein